MIKTEIKFKNEDFDENGNLKVSSILTYMQDAAVKDAEQFGATHQNLLDDNMFFAVYRNIVTIKENIKKGTEGIFLVTFQSNHDRMRFMRSYFIYPLEFEPDVTKNFDPYENAIIYCNSIWILMDFEKRTLLRGNALKYPIEEYTVPFERQLKVDINKETAVKKGDFFGKDYYIDENGHVNNAVYADIAFDFATDTKIIKSFDVTYEHEILPEEKIEVYTQESEGSEKLLGIKNISGAVCFCTEIKY